MERLFDMLNQLTIDPFKQDRFALDPAGAMDKAGLSAEEKALVAHWRSDGHDVAFANGPWARAATLSDPGPDPMPDPDPPGLTC